jgi:hypothetical protein
MAFFERHSVKHAFVEVTPELWDKRLWDRATREKEVVPVFVQILKYGYVYSIIQSSNMTTVATTEQQVLHHAHSHVYTHR